MLLCIRDLLTSCCSNWKWCSKRIVDTDYLVSFFFKYAVNFGRMFSPMDSIISSCCKRYRHFVTVDNVLSRSLGANTIRNYCVSQVFRWIIDYCIYLAWINYFAGQCYACTKFWIRQLWDVQPCYLHLHLIISYNSGPWLS